MKASGEWNLLKITNRNGKVTVEENGHLVNERDFTPLLEKPKQRERYPGLFEGRGQIGLVSRHGAIEFRNIRIKE